tara:strand:+ start:54 stop:731 length:678 start_codon:yes stop_codon:yes gene_type:complete
MKKNGKLIAIIPIRKGSQRIPFKNLKKFCNSSLLEIKINQLKLIDDIDEIVVNSDWDEALNLAKKLNVSTYKRDPYFASSTIIGSEFYKNIAESTPEKYKYIMYAPATSPLIETSTIKEVIKKYFNENNQHDSIVTSSLIKNFMWKDNKPLNYELNKTPRSQDLEEIHSLNHAIVINLRENWINQKSLITKNPILFIINDIESIDVDNLLDFEIAEFLYNKYRNN